MCLMFEIVSVLNWSYKANSYVAISITPPIQIKYLDLICYLKMAKFRMGAITVRNCAFVCYFIENNVCQYHISKFYLSNITAHTYANAVIQSSLNYVTDVGKYRVKSLALKSFIDVAWCGGLDRESPPASMWSMWYRLCYTITHIMLHLWSSALFLETFLLCLTLWPIRDFKIQNRFYRLWLEPELEKLILELIFDLKFGLVLSHKYFNITTLTSVTNYGKYKSTLSIKKKLCDFSCLAIKLKQRPESNEKDQYAK